MQLLELRINFADISPDFDLTAYKKALHKKVSPLFVALFNDDVVVEIEAEIGSLKTILKVLGKLEPAASRLGAVALLVGHVGAFQQGVEYVSQDIVQISHWVAIEAAELAGGFPRKNTEILINTPALTKLAHIEKKVNDLAGDMLKGEASAADIRERASKIAKEYEHFGDLDLSAQDKKVASQVVFGEREQIFREIVRIQPKYADAHVLIIFEKAILTVELPKKPAQGKKKRVSI